MKLKTRVFGVIMVLLYVFLANGCTVEPCKNVVCENGEAQPDASDCVCLCDRGWGGEDCLIENKCVARRIKCDNNGVCDNGLCICVPGFEGDTCEITIRDRFLGNYFATDVCNTMGTLQYSMSIHSNSQILSVLFSSQLANSKFVDSVSATVEGNNLIINTQQVNGNSFSVSGNGSISNGTLTLLYVLTNLNVLPNEIDTCRATWVKQ